METANRGRFDRKRVEAAGNGALLVLVDSLGAWWDFALGEETILRALDHFGFAYRIRDLATGPLTPGELAG